MRQTDRCCRLSSDRYVNNCFFPEKRIFFLLTLISLKGENFHTVFIEDIPELTMNDVNLVRRFITLIDSMYECHVKLIIHAMTAPEAIFKVDLDNQHCDEAFAFDRTQSRLQEMGSDEYLRSRWIGTSSSGDRNPEKVQNVLRDVVLDDRDVQR